MTLLSEVAVSLFRSSGHSGPHRPIQRLFPPYDPAHQDRRARAPEPPPEPPDGGGGENNSLLARLGKRAAAGVAVLTCLSLGAHSLGYHLAGPNDAVVAESVARSVGDSTLRHSVDSLHARVELQGVEIRDVQETEHFNTRVGCAALRRIDPTAAVDLCRNITPP